MNLVKREIQRGIRVNLERILFSFLYLSPSFKALTGNVQEFPVFLVTSRRGSGNPRFVARASTKVDVIAVWFAELRELDGIRLTEETTTTTAHRYQWAVTLIKLDLDARNGLPLNPISVCIVSNYCKQPRIREERRRASIGLCDIRAMHTEARVYVYTHLEN